jgi:catechol 2,3-dioxygenase-like lactoylglutathione lyase family enzyme
MLDHISIGVTDLERSTRFYDAVLAQLGYVRVFESRGASGYAAAGEIDDAFAIRLGTMDFRPPPEMHIAFPAANREAVTRFHDTAIALGATSDGEPQLHPEYGDGYFAAFVLDPDGYRLEAVLHE